MKNAALKTGAKPAECVQPSLDEAVHCPRCWHWGIARERCGFCGLRIPARIHWDLFGGSA